jgi:hypothetical protein
MAYQDTILATSGLVSYWRLGEASGATIADSAGTNTGTATSLAAYGTTGALVGNTDTALSFNGTSSKIDLPSIDFQNKSYTLEAWVKPGSAPTGQMAIFSCWTANATQNAILVLLQTTGIVRLAYYGNDLDTATGTVGFGGSSWYHVVCTYDAPSDTSRIYVNGVQKASGSQGPMVTAGGATAIGYWNRTGGDAFYKGDIDEVALYSQALTENEISEHYRVGQALPVPSLQVSQLAVESLVMPSATPDLQISQLAVESIIRPAAAPDLQLSQLAVEVLIKPVPTLPSSRAVIIG